MNPNITRTIVQRLDDDGNVVGETITTVETWDADSSEETTYGLYL